MKDLSNVTITVLEGLVYVEIVSPSKYDKHLGQTKAIRLNKGDSLPIYAGMFHRVHTVGSSPSNYMYTYINGTKKALDEKGESIEDLELKHDAKSKLPIKQELIYRMRSIGLFLQHVGNALLHIICGIPMMRRIPA